MIKFKFIYLCFFFYFCKKSKILCCQFKHELTHHQTWILINGFKNPYQFYELMAYNIKYQQDYIIIMCMKMK